MPYQIRHINKSRDTELLFQCNWIIDNTVEFGQLTICENAEIHAPEGKMLTMLHNGVVVDPKPGFYSGKIVMHVSDEYVAKPGGLMKFNHINVTMAPAVLIEDGRIVPEKSVPEAIHYAEPTDEKLDGAYIAANGTFNGVIVNNSKYTISNCQMDLEGFGCNDYIGSDSAVAVHGRSEVEINDCEFNLSGVTRCAIHAGGDSKVTVNNCKLINISPESDWTGSFCWQLPYRGSNRLCQTADNAHVVYSNCILRTNGWGIVSVDGVDEDIKVDFNDCYMEAFGPRSHAYGSFCIGPCTLNFNHTTVKLHGFPLICMADEGAGFVNVTNGSKIIGRRFGFISIADSGSAVLFKDSSMDTKCTNFMFRGSHTKLKLENSKFHSASNQFIQVIDNIDTAMDSERYFIPVGIEDVYVEGRDLYNYDPKEDIYMEIDHCDIVGDAMNSTTDIRAYRTSTHNGMGRFHDTLVGMLDFEKLMAEMAAEGAPPEGMPPMDGPDGPPEPPMPDPDENQGPKNLVLKLTGASITGVVSSATQRYRDGLTVISAENPQELNNVIQTPAPTVNNGVLLELDGASRWNVTGTSYITKLTLAEGAVVAAADGSALRMIVDGAETPLAAGEYVGKIVIEKK